MTEHSLTKPLAVLFTVIMVVSMFAPVAGAAVAVDGGEAQMDLGGEPVEDVEQFDQEGQPTTDDGLYEQQSPDDVEIDPELERLFETANGDETVDVVVRLEPADTSGVQGQAATVTALKSHAAQTQQDVVRFAESTEHVEVKKQLWISNAVLLEVDPDRISLDEIAATQGTERLHHNFEMTVAQADDESANSTDADSTDDSASDDSDSTDDSASDDSTSADADDTEPVTPTSMQTNEYDTTYGLEMINATEVWDQHNTQGEGVEVAVLDTGMDDSHPDLPELDDEHWQEWDSNGNPVDSEPSDASGHGTHVSGTVAGAENPAGDVPTYGVAPEVELYHGMVIPGGGGSFVQVAAGMEWAVDTAEVDIISMSLGAPGYFSEMIEPSENARDAGVILVGSAGNSGQGTTGSPGNVYPNFASGAVDENADVASFSSGETIDTDSAWGNDAPDYWPDEYVVPNAAAPGVNVLSSVPGGGYDGTYSGTSMSAPHKAGAFALMLSAAGDLDRDTAIDTMEETAWKPDDADEPAGVPDDRYGNGIIDVAAATDQVALDSGVTGTVTDADGEPVEGATVEVEETGFSAETDADGEYTVLSPPGNYTVTAGGFGYEETSESVEIPDDETFVEQDFELTDALGVELVDGQPAAVEGGDIFEVTVNVANLETYSVERSGSYDGDLTLEFEGVGEIDEGEDVDVGGLTGTATLTVTTQSNTDGELSLDHAFSGAGDSVTVTTGPTEIFAEYAPIAVVDDGTYGDDVVDRLDAQLPASYEISLLTGSEAVDAAADDEHQAYVVQDIDETHVADLQANTEGPTTGVVWLDQWGSSSDAIPARSNALGDPASTSDSFTSPNPEMEIVEDSPLFDGVGDVGDSFGIHSATFADHSWFSGSDFQTVGYVQAGGVTDGDAAAVHEEQREVLLSTFGSSTFVDSGDYSGDADAVLANSAQWASESPPVTVNEGQPVWAGSGDMFGSEFAVNDLYMIKTELADSSTADRSELDLYHGSEDGDNAWGEWRVYPGLMNDEDYPVLVESEDETVGSVTLETTFAFLEDPESAPQDPSDVPEENIMEVTFTTGPTAVYDKPLTVGDGEDVETIQEAVDLAPDGAEIHVTEGTYEETVSIDETANLTITGDNATIAPPAEDSSHAHVSIAADGTQFEGFDFETPDGLAGVGVSASDVTVTDVSVTGASDAIHVEDGTNVELSDIDASGAANAGVSVGASDSVHVADVEVTDATYGVYATDSTDVTVDSPTAMNVSDGVVADGAEAVSVTDAHVDGADEAGISAVDSVNVDVTNATVTDATYGVHADGGMVANVTDNEIAESEYGIVAEGGADVGHAAHNEITNATTGFMFSGFGTSGEFAMNDVDAETGVMASDVGSDLTFHFNDLEMTDTAIAQEGSPFDAPLNWFGDDGPQANNGIDGDVRYSPFLTSPPDAVDTDTTELAVDMTMEADNTYTVGVPATTTQTVGEVFQDDFEGAIYGYDAEDGEWTMLTGDDGVSALSAMLVVAEEDTHVTLNFQHDDEAVTPGSEGLHHGWNLVSPSAYDHMDNAFMEEISGQTYQVDNWMQANEHADGHLGEHMVGDEYVNPFGGYWAFVPAEDAEYTLSANLHINPTMDDYYQDLGLVGGDDPGDSPAEPEDVSVAVVDENDYHEGAIADTLSDELDDDTYTTVDTLTADELLGEMGDYDVFVVQRFGSDSLASDFEDELDDDQGVVYLDSYQGASSEAYADGILRLNNDRNDPSERDSVSLDADGEPVEVDIQANHPIFDGVGSEGDSVAVVDSGTTWGAWFDGYSGQVVGHSDFSPSDEGEFEGPGVAVDADRNEVLNTAIAMDFFHDDPADFTSEGLTLFANSVEEAASMAAASSAADDEVSEEEETEQSIDVESGAVAAAGVGA